MTRVSQNSATQALQHALNKSKSKVEDLQMKGSTLKRIRKPSDDPLSNIESLNITSQNKDNEQYVKNANYALMQLSATEKAIEQLSDIMVKVKEIGIAQSSDFYGASIRKNVANEVIQLKNHVLAIGNKRIGNRYIFGGFKTLDPPFNKDGGYFGDQGHTTLEVSKDFFVPINLNGVEIFFTSDNFDYRDEHPLDEFPELRKTRNLLYKEDITPPELSKNQKFIEEGRLPASIKSKGDILDTDVRRRDNIFNQLTTLITALENNDSELIQSLLPQVDETISRLITLRTRVGSIIGNIERSKDILGQQSIDNESRKSQLIDADVAELFADLIKHQNILKTSYQSGSMSINKTLLDFLR